MTNLCQDSRKSSPKDVTFKGPLKNEYESVKGRKGEEEKMKGVFQIQKIILVGQSQ